MNIIKPNKTKAKNKQLLYKNVSIHILIIIQKNISPIKNFHNSTINKTNNNSISSIKTSKNLNANSKNNYFNKQTPTAKQKISLKHYSIGHKMLFYKKKNEYRHQLNSLGMRFPAEILPKKNNTQYDHNNNARQINSTKHRMYNKISTKNNSLSKKANQANKNKNINNFVYNNLNINHSQNISNISKISKSKKNNANTSNNSHIIIMNNASHNQGKNNKNKSSNPINTYIINTLNLSEKVFFGCGLISSKHQKMTKKINKEHQNEINAIIKEKEENENIIKKQKKLIDKIVEDNQKLENKIKDMENENYQISQKIESQKENQEQLILLVKIIQKSGVDVEELIDKWNNEVEKENANLGTDSINTESIPDSTNELNSKIDPSSFIPINIEKPLVNKKVFKGIPKLNFDIIRNSSIENNGKKEKFKNNSK